MRAVQLQPVKSRLSAALCCRDKVCQHRIHVCTSHLVRHLTHSVHIRQGRWRHQRPVGAISRAIAQRHVNAIPSSACGALAACMAQLQSHLGIRLGVHQTHNAGPCVLLFVIPQSWTTGCDAAFGRNTSHLREHNGSATHCAGAVMHQMKITRHAVDGRIGGHGRYHHTVLQSDAARLQWQKHGRC